MAKQYVYSVESIKSFTLGADGEMGTTGAKQFTPIKKGSVSIEFPEATLTKEEFEDTSETVTLGSNRPAPILRFSFADMDNANLAEVFGGTVDGGTQAWSFPTEYTEVRKSFELITKTLKGAKKKFEIPNGLVNPSGTVNFNSDETAGIEIRVDAEVHTKANGSKVSPMIVTPVTVV